MILMAAGLPSVLSPGGCTAGPQRGEVRHGDGTVAQTGLLVDGLQEGEWTFWYPGGARMALGSYVHDVRTGQWTHWHENGNLRMRGSYRDERQVGPWQFWHPNGALACRGEFRDGREHGEWVFAHASGAEHQRGWFAEGRRQLQWVETSPDGRPASVGSYLDDQPVGTWRRFAADGTETVLEYPLPAGVEHVLERWEDGSLRREGWLRDGVPAGLWQSRHRGGAVRAALAFVAGEPHGEFAAFCADGSLLACGPLVAGRPQGAWVVRAAAGTVALQLEPEPPVPWDRQWSEAEVATQQPPLLTVGRWLAELRSPRAVAARPVAPTAAATPPAAAPPRPEAPTDPGAWTVREREELELFRRYYRDGWLPRRQSAGARYGAAAGSRRLGTGDARLAESIVGRPLPVTTFPTADAKSVDLAMLRGKRVLLVVLRGFTSQVCVYCFAQTAELAPLAARWAELDCEVVVLFPGSKSRLEAFAAACADEFGDQPPPYRMVYDPELELAKALGLQGNLARPASFVLDRQGIVRHAYVAESETNVADRPSAAELLELVAQTR